MNIWNAWFDGATKESNPGLRGIGGVLKGPAGERIEISEEIGSGTNNEAEYAALMAVLDAAVEAKVDNLVVHGDSQLVVRQVNGEWFIKEKNLVPMCKTVLDRRPRSRTSRCAGSPEMRTQKPMPSARKRWALSTKNRSTAPSG